LPPFWWDANKFSTNDCTTFQQVVYSCRTVVLRRGMGRATVCFERQGLSLRPKTGDKDRPCVPFRETRTVPTSRSPLFKDCPPGTKRTARTVPVAQNTPQGPSLWHKTHRKDRPRGTKDRPRGTRTVPGGHGAQQGPSPMGTVRGRDRPRWARCATGTVPDGHTQAKRVRKRPLREGPLRQRMLLAISRGRRSRRSRHCPWEPRPARGRRPSRWVRAAGRARCSWGSSRKERSAPARGTRRRRRP